MDEHKVIGVDEIGKLFRYDAEEGTLWRTFIRGDKPVNMVWEGAGYDETAKVGYRGHFIVATHICFLLKMGRWPNEGMVIEHVDEDVWNCKWNNLLEGRQKLRCGIARTLKSA